MKKNLTNKVISLFLTLILTGILPTAAVFADNLWADTNLIVNGNQQEINLGDVQPGASFTDQVLIYTVATGGNTPNYPITVAFNSNAYGVSSNGGVIANTGTANGFSASVVGNAPTTTGSFSFTISWNTSADRVNSNNAKMVYKGNVLQNKVDAIIDVQGFVGTYDGQPHGASGTATGVNSEDLTGLMSFGDSFTNVSGGVANWSFAGNAQYNPASGAVNIVINKANADIDIIGFNGTYDGQPHGATGTATGIGAVNLIDSIVFGDSFSDVPGGTANWSFSGGENYNDESGSVAIVINQVNPLISWPSASNITYGQSLANSNLTGGSSDIEGSFVFTDPTIKPNAGSGSYSVNFIPTDSVNYSQVTGSVSVNTEKADAIINITGFTGTYDGQSHGATGSALGVNDEDLSSSINFGTTFTDVPGGTATWNYTGGTNYNDESGSVEIVINKASATISVFGADVEYDGEEHGATGTATGINDADLASGLELGSKFTNVPGGTAAWTFDGGINYENESGSVEIVIFKADPEIIGWPLASNITYGQSLADSNFTEGLADIEGAFAFEDPTIKPNAGTQAYTVNFLPLDAINYNQLSGSVNVTTEKANATISITGYSGTYDGQLHGATGSAFGVSGEDLSSSIDFGDTFVDVPGGTATWSFTGGINYEDDNGSVGILINKAKALVTVSGVTAIYDGEEHGATGSATGVDDVNLTHLIDFGVKYMVVPGGFAIWNFYGGTNYEDQNGQVEIVINQATPIVTTWPSASSIIYGDSLADSNLTGGLANVLGTFVFDDPSIKPVAGTQAYSVTFMPTDGTNYKQVTGSVNVVTEKADATLNISGFTGTYDGLAHSATGTAVGVGGEVLSSAIDFGDSFTDVPGGTADWTFTGGANYNDENGSVAIVINKARANVSVSGVTVDYDAEEHGATGTATGINDIDLSDGFDFGMKFTDVPGGTANWTFDGGINYEDENGSVAIVINKIRANVSVSGVTVDYDAEEHGAIGTATGINDINLSDGFDYGMKFTDVPGGTANWTFDGGINYEDESGSVPIVINKIRANVSVSGVTVDYDAEEHGATGTATGINDIDLSDGFDFGMKFTNVPGGTATWTFDGGINYEDENGSVAIVINQATPVLTWPMTTLILGQKLESAGLIGGVSSVPGTFTFNAPLTIPAPGNFEFDATFAPTDTLNYKTLTGKIKVATHYNFSGVLQPINRDGSSVFKAGSTIPVKFQLFNSEGAPISTSFARISYVKITDGVAGPVTEAISTSAATSGNLFRYDATSQQYIFNLNTKGLKSGTYELRIILDDGTINTVRVGLR